MSSGPSIKIFSDYLSKIYNIPHASTFTSSTEPGSHPPKSSAKPTEQAQIQQIREGPSHAQNHRDGAGLEMNLANLEAGDDRTSPTRDSDEVPARSNDLQKNKHDKPVEAKMNQADVYRTADDKQKHSDGKKAVKKSQCGKPAVVKKIYPQERKDHKKNQDDRSTIESNFDGKTDVRHVPTVVEHVLQNKTDVLSPISSRNSLTEKCTKSQGGALRTKDDISLTVLDELSCSMKIDEELLSSSYDQGLVRTFGRGGIEGPIAQSTLRSALEAVDEKTELWTTVVAQESIEDKTEMWTDTFADKTEPLKLGTQDCTDEVKAALEKTEPWTDETMTLDDEEDGWLEQTATKNVVEMQKLLLQPQKLNSPCKVPLVINSPSKVPVAIKPLVSDKHSVNNDVTLTDEIAHVNSGAKRKPSLNLCLKEPNDFNKSKTNAKSDDQMNCISQNKDGKILEMTKEKTSKAEKTEVLDFKSPSKLEEIKCKRCQLELSTREALKMHTCYSILDKLIQSDGGTRRRNSASGGNKSRVTPAPKSDATTKPKKKVNSIIAIKDHKLANGEILAPYVLSQERMEEKIKNDRVDEEQTTLVSPRLKKGSQVFNLNPTVLHKIKDKPKDKECHLFVNPSPAKLTTNCVKAANVTSNSVTNNPSTDNLITKSVMGSTDKVTDEFTISAVKLTPVPSEVKSNINASTDKSTIKLAIGFANLSEQSLEQLKRKAEMNIVNVNLPNQSLSQLKRKAETQHLTFKRRDYRTIFEKGKVNSEEKVHTKDLDHSSQKIFDLQTLNGFHQRKYEDKEKQLDQKFVKQKNTEEDGEQRHRENHLDENSAVQKQTEGDGQHKVRENYFNEKCLKQKKDEGKNEHEHREKYSDEKSVKQKKIGEEYDYKKKRESLDKKGGMEKSNKMLKEEGSSKSGKRVFEKGNTVGSSKKAIGNLHKDKKIISLGKKDALGKKDDTTKVSEVPQKNIVNHFKAYNPHLHSEDSPQRKRHKSDKTPSSHKERNDRKVKSEERHSTKSKLKCSPCKSVSSPKKFKIPKYNNGDKPPKKVKGFAPAKFLQNENIKTLAVGESGSSLLKSLLSEMKGDSTKAIEMFDKIDSKQNKMAKNNRYAAKEDQERSDIAHEGWNQVKNAKDDTERKKLTEQEFGNPVPNHPSINLSYHGYKRYKSGSKTDHHPLPSSSIGFWDNSKDMPMYHLTNGAPTPLPGYTFTQKPNDDHLQLSCEENKEKLKLNDFVTLMKAVMYNKKAKKEGKGDDRKLMEEFETFLGHYKAGQEETTHFLEFYQNQGQVELEGWQAIQIMDLENQFSTYQGYYGLTDELSCVTCNKKHTFAL